MKIHRAGIVGLTGIAAGARHRFRIPCSGTRTATTMRVATRRFPT